MTSGGVLMIARMIRAPSRTAMSMSRCTLAICSSSVSQRPGWRLVSRNRSVATGVVPYFSIQENQSSTNASDRCGKPGIICSGMSSMPLAPNVAEAAMQSSSDIDRRKYSSW